jgi:hypothetical protein
MGGEIVNPGDLYGRVIQADHIELAWDGNLISALVGEDLVIGVSGFGESVHRALIELAENLAREAVWVAAPEHGRVDVGNISPAMTVQ